MNDFDELRAALERASETPPLVHGRAEAARRRGTQIRRRRRLVASAATLAVVAGAVAVTVPLWPHSTGGSERLSTSDLAPSPTPINDVTDTPSPSPSPSSTSVSAPAPATIPALSPTPSPTATASAAADDLQYSVQTRLDPASSADYPVTDVSVHVQGQMVGSLWPTRSAVVSGPTLYVDPNETIGYVQVPSESCSNNGGLQPIDRTFTFHYAFRQSGAYPIRFGFATGTCDSSGDQLDQHSWRTVIDVPAGSTKSNGPAQPRIYDLHDQPLADGQVNLIASAWDDDGYVTSISVDWGNGAAPAKTDFASCPDRARYWPAGANTTTVTSPNLSPGTYTVTATATSTGCDGTDAQTATRQLTITIANR